MGSDDEDERLAGFLESEIFSELTHQRFDSILYEKVKFVCGRVAGAWLRLSIMHVLGIVSMEMFTTTYSGLHYLRTMLHRISFSSML